MRPASIVVPNRISGWTYDAAGNILQVGGMTRSFSYDAENQQVTATINGNTASYTFDGLGQRVKKVAGGTTTVYVYDAFGNLDAEYSSGSSTSPCGTQTCYLTWDHLGSLRMLTDTSANATARYDYLPFGGELLAGINGRTTAMGYFSSPDATGPKFTGQMRDPETYDPNGGTALDWFITRAMSGAQGRFQSVDPGNAGAAPGDPQTWNAYSYVGNNPLSYTDPSGLGFWSTFLDILGQFFGGNGGISGQPGGPIPNIGGVNSGEWNEQIPYSLGGGGGVLSTGGVFGSGNTDPFIFSIRPSETLGGPPNEQSLSDWLRAWISTVGFFGNWVTGTGPTRRFYGPSDYRAKDLAQSQGFQDQLAKIAEDCAAGKTSGNPAVGTIEAYGNIPHDAVFSPVGGQVGGWGGGKSVWSRSGTSDVDVTVHNEAGTQSFFLHAPPNIPASWGSHFPMRIIDQTFKVHIPNVCSAN